MKLALYEGISPEKGRKKDTNVAIKVLLKISLLSLDQWLCYAQDAAPTSNGEAKHSPKDSTDEEGDGAFDVSKIKGKLAKRPPKGVGAAKKEKGKEKKGADKKPKKVCLQAHIYSQTFCCYIKEQDFAGAD